MKMRHFVVALAAMLMVAGTLFANGQSETTAKKSKQLGILFQNSNIPDDTIVQGYAQSWAKEKNVNLNFQTVDESQLKSKTVAAIESKSGPDLIVFPDYTAFLYHNDLMNMDNLVGGLAQQYGGWFPVAKQAFYFNGHWKAIPYKTFSKPIVYRKDLLKKVGAEVPQSWQDLAKVSKEISDQVPGVYGFGVAIAPRSDGPNFIRALLWAFGGSVQDQNGKVDLDSPQSIAAFTFLKNWYKSGGMAPGVAGWNDSTNNTAFLAGKIAMTYNASSIYLSAKKQFPDTLGKTTGQAMVPEGPKGRFGQESAQGLAIPSYSKNSQTALDFLKYMYTPDRLKHITSATDAGAIMMLNDPIKSLPLWDNPDIGVLLKIAKASYLTGYPGKMTRGAAAVRSQYVLVNSAAAMISQDLSPEQAIKSATKKIKAIYAQNQ